MNRKTLLIILDIWSTGRSRENDAIPDCSMGMFVPNEADLFMFGL